VESARDDALETPHAASGRTTTDGTSSAVPDVNAGAPEDYARRASVHLQRGVCDGWPIKIDQDGVIRVHDPVRHIFGAYNPDGTARTFFKPTSATYWERQRGTAPWER